MNRMRRLSFVVIAMVAGLAGQLALAADIGDVIFAKQNDQLRQMIKADPRLVNSGKPGDQPIFIAVYAGNAQALEILIEAGANVNAMDRHGDRPLYKAIISTNYVGDKAIEKLIAAGAQVDAGPTPALHGAVMFKHPERVKLLLKHGAKLDSVAKDGSTLLGFAAYAGDLQIIKKAVESGVKIDFAGRDHRVLFSAAVGGNLELIEYLIAQGADVNAKSRNGSVIDWVVSAKVDGSIDVVKLLLKHKADVNSAEPSKRSALRSAASNGDLELVKLLVEAGADINSPTGREYWTPLIAAARRCQDQVVKYLLEKGADPFETDRYSRSALDHARQPDNRKASPAATIKLLEEATAGKSPRPDQVVTLGVDKIASAVNDEITARLVGVKPPVAGINAADATPAQFNALAYRYYMFTLEADYGATYHFYITSEKDNDWAYARVYAAMAAKLLREQTELTFPDQVDKAKAAELRKKTRQQVMAALSGGKLTITGDTATLMPRQDVRVDELADKLPPIVFTRYEGAWLIDVQKTSNTNKPGFDKEFQALASLSRARVATICDLRTGDVESADKVPAHVQLNLVAASMVR